MKLVTEYLNVERNDGKFQRNLKNGKLMTLSKEYKESIKMFIMSDECSLNIDERDSWIATVTNNGPLLFHMYEHIINNVLKKIEISDRSFSAFFKAISF